MALLNTMVGSVTLILPTNFTNGGLISSLILLLFIGFITYKTSKIIIVN